MLEAALRDHTADTPATFELFTRALPPGRGFGVVAGTDRALQAITNFKFDESELEFLAEAEVVSGSTLEYLAKYKFSGGVRGIPEGGLFFGHTPILELKGSFAECLILETVLLSIFNHDSAVASAATRMVIAARGRPIVEMGSRRTHERSAVEAARAAYLVGASATSNLEAGRSYGIPTAGTVAHAFILAHDNEADAFRSQFATQGAATTYLVDTFDIEQGIRNAVAIAGIGIGAIRIDSGDPHVEAQRARQLLDSLGARSARIVLSGDLDEFAIKDLQNAPIDSFGVGTRLVTGSGYPTCNFVYKLVAIGGSRSPRGVAKLSDDKVTFAGAKRPLRAFDVNGKLGLEVLGCENVATLGSLRDFGLAESAEVHRDLIAAGERIFEPTLNESRNFHQCQLESLPRALLEIGGDVPTLRSLRYLGEGKMVPLNPD